MPKQISRLLGMHEYGDDHPRVEPVGDNPKQTRVKRHIDLFHRAYSLIEWDLDGRRVDDSDFEEMHPDPKKHRVFHLYRQIQGRHHRSRHFRRRNHP